MWPFNNKKTELKTEIRKEKIDVGKTLIKYTLLDGKEFYSNVYGNYCQNTKDLTHKREVEVKNSLTYARQSLYTYPSYYDVPNVGLPFVTLTDNGYESYKSITGQIISVEIIKTEPYEIEYDVKYLIKD